MNSVILVGRLSRDPEVRYTPSGLAVARFSVAVDRAPSKNAQENQPTADFINVTAFGKTAELIERFFTKGKRIGVQGRLQNDNYTNRDGAKVYSYVVIADRVEFVDNKGESGDYNGGSYGGNGGGYPGGGFSGGSQPQNAQDSGIPEGFEQIDDDLPF